MGKQIVTLQDLFGRLNPLLRVCVTVKPVTDPEVMARCIKERPFLKKMGIDNPVDPILAVFHLYTGEAFFMDFYGSVHTA